MEDNYVNCDICCKSISKNKLFEHKKEHFKEKLICSVCEKSFTQTGSLKRHEVQVHKIIHGKRENYTKKYKQKYISMPCDICNKILKSKSVLKQHMVIHTQEKAHKCDTCGKSFTQGGSLKRHEISAHRKDELETLDCNMCGQSYSGRENLSHHMKNTHASYENGLNPYWSRNISYEVCPVCKAKLKTKIMNEAHYRYFHQNIDTCVLCNVKIRNKAHLKRHVEQAHTDASYECDKCSKKYKQQRILKQHVIDVHGEKNIQCKVCNKILSCASSLYIHMKMHSNTVVVCESCPKSFPNDYLLKRHRKLHSKAQTTRLLTEKSKKTNQTREKKEICKICGRGFKTVTQLKKHSDVHTTLMHYFCQYCSRGFKQGGTQKRHEQRCLKSKENQPLN